MTRACLLVCCLVAATTAHADKKLQDLAPNFIKESASCVIEARGLTAIVSGTTTLAGTLKGSERDAVTKDLATLTAANATVSTWCTSLEVLIKFLGEHAADPYKTVQQELDVKYRAVVAARTAAKKTLTDITAITRALIPRIKRTPGAAPEPAPEPTVLPSTRKLVLPKASGTWSVSGNATSDTVVYTDKTSTATTTSRQFSDGSCDDQRAVLAKKSDSIADLEPPPNAKGLGVVWSVRLTLRGPTPHVLLAMCANGSSQVSAAGRAVKGVLVSSDITPASNKSLWPDMTTLMTDMLAAQLVAP